MNVWKISSAALAGLLLAGAAGAATSTPIDIKAAIANPDRPEADTARDADRKPAETIAFSGLKAGDKVVELAPGGGYFTRILLNAVGPNGHVYAMIGRPSPALADYAASHPNLTLIETKPGEITVAEPVDMVWTTLNYHDFKNAKVGDSDAAISVNKAAFAALKPGGIYFITDHQAAKGAGASVTSTLHRIEEATVKQEVEAAGFKLDGESNILHHAADDHSEKVFETGVRGKTDQFVLRFRKPRG